ncbi:MAG TPA: type II toxin-antitoxin system RelE/ParE family toxin [Roseiarcus sp.]
MQQEPAYKLIWSPEAESDLLEIWQFGAARFSPDTADTHLRDIDHAAERLTLFPMKSDEREALRPSLRSIVVYPTVIFFRIQGRVIDGRRNFAAFFSSDGDE